MISCNNLPLKHFIEYLLGFFQVGSILIQMLLDTAFLQSPASQSGDDHSELRPAFRHFMKSMAAEGYVADFATFGAREVF